LDYHRDHNISFWFQKKEVLVGSEASTLAPTYFCSFELSNPTSKYPQPRIKKTSICEVKASIISKPFAFGSPFVLK
jgi:hypothetical protein